MLILKLYLNIFNAEYNKKLLCRHSVASIVDFQSLQTMKESLHLMNNESRAGHRRRGARNEVRADSEHHASVCQLLYERRSSSLNSNRTNRCYFPTGSK